MLMAAILLSGLGYLWAVSKGHTTLRYVLKPGTMLLMIALAVTGMPAAGRYGQLILAGLAASTAGDICLLLPNRFLQGLAAFFVAHLLYILAFTVEFTFRGRDLLLLTALALAAVPVFRLLRPGVLERGGPGLLFAVGLYMTAISVMVWRAVALGDPLVIAGAVLFYISDAILAVNRFAKPFAWADYAVMTTYYGAQYCIALSLTQR